MLHCELSTSCLLLHTKPSDLTRHFRFMLSLMNLDVSNNRGMYGPIPDGIGASACLLPACQKHRIELSVSAVALCLTCCGGDGAMPVARCCFAGHLRFMHNLDIKGTSMKGPAQSPVPCFLYQATNFDVPQFLRVGLT